ncbi:hypothetical protein ACVILL_004068 [Bradyrhizobium sp. USDA 3364]
MPVERDRVLDIVDAEAMLGKAWHVRTEQPAAGRHHQPIVGQRLPRVPGGDDLHGAGVGVDRLGAALHIDDVDRVEDVEQRRGQRFRLRLVEPRADHERRLRRHQRDFEVLGRNARMSRRRAAESAAYMPAKPAPMMTSRMGYFLWVGSL